MNRIARAGMKGRKKDTLLLLFVISLSFMLTVTTVLLYSSTQYTAQRQREEAFGCWGSALFRATEEEAETLQEMAGEKSVGQIRLIGTSDEFGLIGEADEEAFRLGNFHLQEGRLPQAEGEIAVEASALAACDADLSVGDTVEVTAIITLYELGQGDIEEKRSEITLGDEVYRDSWNDHMSEKYPESAVPRGQDGSYILYIYIDGYTKAREVLPLDVASAIFEETGILREELTVEDCPEDEYMVCRYYWEYFQNQSFYVREYPDYDSWLGEVMKINIGKSYRFNTRKSVDGSQEDAMHSRVFSEWQGPSWYGGERVDERNFFEHAFVVKQFVETKRELTICGILENYSSQWETGVYEMPAALVSRETGYAYLENGIYQLTAVRESGYEAPRYVFLDYPVEVSKEEGTALWGERYLLNTATYQDEDVSADWILTCSIVAFIAVATVFSVFQIFLTQMRRRTRRLALLKSIGATNGQLAELLFWEGVYLIGPGLVVGTALGLGAVSFALWWMEGKMGVHVILHVNVPASLGSLCCAAAAVALGMSLPGVKALNVPLIGSMDGMAGARRKKDRKGGGKIVRTSGKVKKETPYRPQTVREIGRRRWHSLGRQRLLQQGLYAMVLSVALSALMLAFLLFQEYDRGIVQAGKADYGLELFYGMDQRSLGELEDRLEKLDSVEQVSAFRKGEQAYVWFERIGDSGLLAAFRQLLPSYLYGEHFSVGETYANVTGTDTHYIDEAVRTGIYGIEAGGSIYEELKASVQDAELDDEAFAAGEQVIVLVPLAYEGKNQETVRYTRETLPGETGLSDRMGTLLEASGCYDLSYHSLYRGFYEREDVLKAGDMLRVSAPLEEHTPGSGSKTNKLTVCQVTVGAVIDSFEGEGLWPFSGTDEAYVIIGSDLFLQRVYPYMKNALGRMTEEELGAQKVLSPTRYGKTEIYIRAKEGADPSFTEAEIRSVLRGSRFVVTDYAQDNQAVYNRAFRLAAMAVLLAAAAIGIAVIVLWNMGESGMEQQRNRIGILQAIGMKADELWRYQLKESIRYILGAMLAAHLILAVILASASYGKVTLFGMAGTDFVRYLFQDLLHGYPWGIHGLVCVIFGMIALCVHCLPLRPYLKCQPIDNIRSVGR